MEVFRQIPSGLVGGNTLADDVSQASPPLEHWRKFVYCQSMTGRVFGDVDHFKVVAHFFLLLFNLHLLVCHGDICSFIGLFKR